MNTIHTDLNEGVHLDIEVEFLTRRVVRRGDEPVHRLLVADSRGTQFAVLTTPDCDMPVGLRAGETYRLYGLLGADPGADNEPTGDGMDCPTCGSPLRPERVLDAVDSAVSEAADQLGLEEPFGIIDNRTCLRESTAETTPAEDWIPMDAGGSTGRLEMVCTSCHRRVAGGCADSTAESRRATPTGVETDRAGADREPTATGFRASIAGGYVPQPAAVRDCALFCEHQVAAGERTESDGVFTPRVGAGVSEHPLTGQTERYLSVGLDATFEGPAFVGPRLEMVVVLDISGSMERPVGVDPHGERAPADASDGDVTTKLERASQVLGALAEQLGEKERLGVVLCNHRAHVARPLRAVGDADVDAIAGHLRDLDPGGATNLAEGCETARRMFASRDQNRRSERRVVVLSDLLANTGTTAADDLAATFADASTRGIHPTLLGIGLDANAELAARLTEVRGASYCAVSPSFERRLDGALDCLFTPVVYDLTVELDAPGYEIAAVHGRPPAVVATDTLVHAGTLFPSVSDGVVHGGPVLVRVTGTGNDPEPELCVSWTERGGGEYTERIPVDIPDHPGTFTDDGVRTAVALGRYGRELRSWAANCYEPLAAARDPDRDGPPRVPLAVSTRQNRRFEQLRAYLEGEMERTSSQGLQRELELLDALSRLGPETAEVAD